MALLKLAVLSVPFLMAAAPSSAQHKFPLRSGEWSVSVSGAAPSDQQPSLLYCLNDEQWTKALTQDPACIVSNLVVTPIGVSYHMVCQMKVVQTTGDEVMTFDGMEHMTAKGSFAMTFNGKTTSSTTHAEYHWKGPTCSPDDMNLRPRHTK